MIASIREYEPGRACGHGAVARKRDAGAVTISKSGSAAAACEIGEPTARPFAASGSPAVVENQVFDGERALHGARRTDRGHRMDPSSPLRSPGMAIRALPASVQQRIRVHLAMSSSFAPLRYEIASKMQCPRVLRSPWRGWRAFVACSQKPTRGFVRGRCPVLAQDGHFCLHRGAKLKDIVKRRPSRSQMAESAATRRTGFVRWRPHAVSDGGCAECSGAPERRHSDARTPAPRPHSGRDACEGVKTRTEATARTVPSPPSKNPGLCSR